MKTRLLPMQGWRLTLFQAVIFAMFALFSIRLYELQISDFDTYETRANENRLSSFPIPASRGAIRDRYDVRLAFNVPAYNVTIIPANLPANREEELRIYNRLSALVEVPPTREIALSSGQNIRSIEELVAEGAGIAPFRPVVIAQDVPLRVAMQILEERIYMPGVDIESIGVREYPTGETSAHIVGYMGPIPEEEAEALRDQGYNPAFDRIGYEGVERFLEDTLGGKRGSRLREVDVAGEVLGVISEVPPVPGQSVRLTLDVELQRAAEDILKRMLAFRNEIVTNAETRERVASGFNYRGLTSQGVVIAMNPKTGEILALVSLPTYDNSRFSRAIDGQYYLDLIADPARPLVNNSIKGLYPPGSVWKLITAAGVAEENVIRPETKLRDDGEIIIENRYAPNDPAAFQRFVCWLRTGHGRVDFLQSIAWSCDVYFYQVGGGNNNLNPQVLRPGGLGIEDLFRYATATGIGSELGIELPFEVSGRMPDRDWKRRNYGENWSTGDTYNAAFGQGYVTVTPLQLLTQVASFVNNGTLYQPTIIRDFLDEEGNVVVPFAPQVLRTLNLGTADPAEPITLLLLEDMLMKGPTSLACTCESNSPYYDPYRCDPQGYRNTVNLGTDFAPDERLYKVHIPLGYNFNGNVCQPIRFPNPTSPYRPAFLSSTTLGLVREGMRQAVTLPDGTAKRAILPEDFAYINVAGKTGTAEYCDDIAQPLGYCVPGQWPAHAWYVGYAPYEDPEIVVVAFVYNGGEGSQIALPVVRDVMTAYFQLKETRGEALPPDLSTPVPEVIPTSTPEGQ